MVSVWCVCERLWCLTLPDSNHPNPWGRAPGERCRLLELREPAATAWGLEAVQRLG